jgi:hypothetical protein
MVLHETTPDRVVLQEVKLLVLERPPEWSGSSADCSLIAIVVMQSEESKVIHHCRLVKSYCHKKDHLYDQLFAIGRVPHVGTRVFNPDTCRP